MILLGLDASTPKGSVALLMDGQIIAESVASSTFSDQLLVLMDEVLGKLDRGLEEVDGFCVTTGPGSFTGLRVGVSLIKDWYWPQKNLSGESTLWKHMQI